MRLAYLIAAHDNPRHLGRLVGALASSEVSCFVHVDRKVCASEFESAAGEGVRLVSARVPVYWGDFSQVEATLVLLGEALADARRFEYFVFISGTDYPLRSPLYIERFFERNAGKEFMNLVPVPCAVVGKPLSRFTAAVAQPAGTSTRADLPGSAGAPERCARSGERALRPFLGDLRPFAGSSWWALSRGACEYVLAFAAAERRVVEFFENADCPDESFFQTILGNSSYCSRICPNLTYTDWEDDASSPTHLTEPHVEFLESNPSLVVDQSAYGVGEILFARKFSDGADALLARVDRLRAGAQATAMDALVC